MFLYAGGRIQWASSARFDRNIALAGINAGDGRTFVTIPGSLISRILSVPQTSNVGIPGIWIFRVDQSTYTIQLYYVIIYCMHLLVPPNKAPSNFTVLAISATFATFQWDSLSDQQANGIIRQYVIICTETKSNIKV